VVGGRPLARAAGHPVVRHQSALHHPPVDAAGAFWSWLDKKNMELSTPMKMMIGMILTGLSFGILYFAANAGGFNKPVFEVVQSSGAETLVKISPEARAHLGITTPPVKLADGTEVWRVTNSGAPTAKGEFVGFEGEANGQINTATASRVSAIWLIIAYLVLSLGELMLSPMGLSLVSKVAPIRMRGMMMGGWFVATAIGNKLTGVAGYWDLWSHSYFFILLAGMAGSMAVVLLLVMRPLKKAMPGV
jgi:dipeptide/tripeptide permease